MVGGGLSSAHDTQPLTASAMATPYVVLADLNGKIPTKFLIEALDDNKDGAADSAAWDAVVKDVHQEIDGKLGVRYPVPFSNPIPAIVLTAASVFAAEALYNRRGFQGEDKNPWTKRANAERAQLLEIAKGEIPLKPEIQRAAPSASIVAEGAKTTSRAGRTMA